MEEKYDRCELSLLSHTEKYILYYSNHIKVEKEKTHKDIFINYSYTMKVHLLLIALTIFVGIGANNVTKLRGTMINPLLEAADFRVLASWNANHIRWQLLWGGFPHGPADKGDIPAYEAWLETILGHLDSLLPVFREIGIKVLLDLHTPPGGRDQNDKWPLFYNQNVSKCFSYSLGKNGKSI